MSKIKVTVNSISQANEIIEYWNDKGVELYIGVKENTTDENSDVYSLKKVGLVGNVSSSDSIHTSATYELEQISSEIIGILIKHELNHLAVMEVLSATEKVMAERSYHLVLRNN